MFHPLSVYVGLRYVRARSYTFFVPSHLGVARRGVCGRRGSIVILSVMNGFECELREPAPLSECPGARDRGAYRGGRLAGRAGVADWQNAARMRRARGGCQGLRSGAAGTRRAPPRDLPVLLRGIDPRLA